MTAPRPLQDESDNDEDVKIQKTDSVFLLGRTEKVRIRWLFALAVQLGSRPADTLLFARACACAAGGVPFGGLGV